MEQEKKKIMRRPGIEPGSTAWKAAMLTIIPPTQACLQGTISETTIEVHHLDDALSSEQYTLHPLGI